MGQGVVVLVVNSLDMGANKTMQATKAGRPSESSVGGYNHAKWVQLPHLPHWIGVVTALLGHMETYNERAEEVE